MKTNKKRSNELTMPLIIQTGNKGNRKIRVGLRSEFEEVLELIVHIPVRELSIPLRDLPNQLCFGGKTKNQHLLQSTEESRTLLVVHHIFLFEHLHQPANVAHSCTRQTHQYCINVRSQSNFNRRI